MSFKALLCVAIIFQAGSAILQLCSNYNVKYLGSILTAIDFVQIGHKNPRVVHIVQSTSDLQGIYNSSSCTQASSKYGLCTMFILSFSPFKHYNRLLKHLASVGYNPSHIFIKSEKSKFDENRVTVTSRYILVQESKNRMQVICTHCRVRVILAIRDVREVTFTNYIPALDRIWYKYHKVFTGITIPVQKEIPNFYEILDNCGAHGAAGITRSEPTLEPATVCVRASFYTKLNISASPGKVMLGRIQPLIPLTNLAGKLPEHYTSTWFCGVHEEYLMALFSNKGYRKDWNLLTPLDPSIWWCFLVSLVLIPMAISLWEKFGGPSGSKREFTNLVSDTISVSLDQGINMRSYLKSGWNVTHYRLDFASFIIGFYYKGDLLTCLIVKSPPKLPLDISELVNSSLSILTIF